MSQPRSLRSSLTVVVMGLLLAVAGCGGAPSDTAGGSAPGASSSPASPSGSGSGSGSPSGARGSAAAGGSPSASSSPSPTGPPMLLDAIAPLSGTTVGVAMPISIIFTTPVKASARARIERHIELTTSAPVVGAWHWFGSQRADFRPKRFWKPGTSVSMVARFDHVGDGYGRYGTHSYTRHFRVGDDVHTHVYVNEHRTVVTRDGSVLRRMSTDAGSPQFPSWDGTMAVVSKQRNVRMTSCSVQITCDPTNPDFYDIVLPWDVRITNSGTFLHYSTGDPHPGHSYGSHGCVHLSRGDAQWYYDLTKQGDPVTITGSPRGKAAGDNGYADYNVPWREWLAGSGLRQFTTST